MAQYAIIDMKSKWILSLHGRKNLATARLRAYVSGILDGGSTEAVAPWLPPGTAHTGMIPHLRIVKVNSSARARAFYRGEIQYSAQIVKRPRKKVA